MTSNHAGRIAALVAFTLPLPFFVALAACHGKSETAAVDAAPPPPPSAPVNETVLPAASITKFVNPQSLPPYDGPTGTVEGTVRVEGPEAPDAPAQSYAECPDGKAVYGKLFREGAPGPDGLRPLADAVVAVTGYSGAYVPERQEAATVTIEGCAPPRTIVMTMGQRLDVKNATKQFWAPAIEQLPTPALMIAAPTTLDPIHFYPPKPGWYALIDKMKHTYARSDLYVLLQPLHAVSDLAGHYRIDGIPVGKLKVGAHVAAVGDGTADVEVLAGVVKTVDLVLHYAPKAPVDAGAPAPKVDGGRAPERLH
jgi:hypothetical protein